MTTDQIFHHYQSAVPSNTSSVGCNPTTLRFILYSSIDCSQESSQWRLRNRYFLESTARVNAPIIVRTGSSPITILLDFMLRPPINEQYWLIGCAPSVRFQFLCFLSDEDFSRTLDSKNWGFFFFPCRSLLVEHAEHFWVRDSSIGTVEFSGRARCFPIVAVLVLLPSGPNSLSLQHFCNWFRCLHRILGVYFGCGHNRYRGVSVMLLSGPSQSPSIPTVVRIFLRPASIAAARPARVFGSSWAYSLQGCPSNDARVVLHHYPGS